MANFVIVVDPDRERRSRFIEVIKPLIAPVEGLVVSECGLGDFGAVWASSGRAPVSQVVDEVGAAVLWGEAVPGGSSERLRAEELRERWREVPDRVPVALDGFHAGVVYRREVGVTVGADLLGIYPVYYYCRGEVLLVGSSEELFRHHPEFEVRLNAAGLVGMLLLMHLVDGQTLLAGVRRLGAGNMLVWRSGESVREVEQYRVPVSVRYFDLSFEEQVEVLSEVMEETMQRRVEGGREYTLLLSGGLDSRLLGGYLRRAGVRVEALTLGIGSDIDMQCAVRVARSLGIKQHRANIEPEQYPECAELQARWEHGANGFSTILGWGLLFYLKNLPASIAPGYLMDRILGGTKIDLGHSASARVVSFEKTFSHHNISMGIPVSKLQTLLRAEVFGDLVQETIARLRQSYESYAEFEYQRAWCFDLYHRQRFHIGGHVWRMSFGAWPVMPVVDARVIECVAGMPAATIADRQAQKEILCRQFPQLASLPLAQNTRDKTEPLRPRIRYTLMKSVKSSLSRFASKPPIERRYFVRTYDFNGPGWMAIRRQAEPYRERILHLFNQEPLDQLLPPAGVFLPDAYGQDAGLKTLLGFMLWSKEYL